MGLVQQPVVYHSKTIIIISNWIRNKLTSISYLIRLHYTWNFNLVKSINLHRGMVLTLLGPIIQRFLEEEKLTKENAAVNEIPNNIL